MSDMFRSSVLTISDSCFSGHSHDRSGPLIQSLLKTKGFQIVQNSVVSDDRHLIEATLKEWCDSSDIDLIITTGGTGFTARDVTPEATRAILDKEAPGIVVALITSSLKVTPMAMISRLTAGIRGSTLVINFPGSAKACEECFATVEPVLIHAIHQLRECRSEISKLHKAMQHKNKSNVRLQSIASRPRHSQYPMVSMDAAIKRIICETVPIKDVENISVKDFKTINHRIVANDLTTQISVPPFRASIKDGYAVVASQGSGHRKVLIGLTAGQSPQDIRLTPEYCIRISTGAALPEGADAVVQVEDTSIVELTSDGEESVINIEKEPKIGQDIRPIGCDIALGEKVVNGSTRLGLIELGLLASVGVHSIPVIRRPIVAVLSTGDEIIDPGQSLKFGQIWDSNRTTIMSLLAECCVDIIDLGIASDTLDDIYDRMFRGLSSADVLITTGGVSMGERDLLKEIMKTDFKANLHFGRVNLKPGKPTTFATCDLNNNKKYIFGLPGNPVSAVVTFHLFVKPLIRCLSGENCGSTSDIKIMSLQKTLRVKVKIGSESYKLDERPELVRAVLTFETNDMPTAVFTGNQRSSRLLSAKEANVMVLLPQRSDDLRDIKSGFVTNAIII